MAKFTVETRDGTEIEVNGKDGATLMKLIRRAGVEELVAQCGGSCACATCHVYLTAPGGATIDPMGPAESRMLATATDRMLESRLSCQIKFDASLEGMRIRIAPEDRSSF
jgi:2Fe-2S ferredoxin